MSASPPQPAARPDLAEMLEAERRRIASEVQTRILDQARLVLAQVGFYEQAAAEGSVARTQFGVVAALLRQLLENALELEAALYPALLQAAGLGPALEGLLAQARRAHGVQALLSLPRPVPALAPAHELFIYRAMQEALRDALLRGAGNLWLALSSDAGHLICRIEDDGRAARPGALALMEAQAASLGCRLQAGPHAGGWALQIDLPDAPAALTPREQAVLRLLALGCTNKEIAQRLHIRPRTVKFHLDNVYSKLGVTTRTEAAIIAVQQGWIAPD